ncbi:MAG: isoprenoid biosynthesis glyoxalase ElbB [Deltaproteobacteria bacterium]|nr:isoprenoid biosynthesis glyoxalase ElbB [Deltaproteobacteria bacterium]
MATRVGVVLSGCGAADGSEISEAILVLYWIERAGARAICMAPDAVQPRVVDHLSGAIDGQAAPRRVTTEAARIVRGRVRDIASVQDHELDALVFPGGGGVASVLSNYAEKGVVCEVHPEVGRLLKAMLKRHRPMGFVCMAPILAARVLGPAAGVRVTFGTKACEEAKHAAIMGADVRPCPLREILVDQKNRVVCTPAFMYEEARLSDVGFAIERLVRQVVTLARDRQPRPQAGAQGPPPRDPGQRGPQPQAAPQAAGGVVIRKPGAPG